MLSIAASLGGLQLAFLGFAQVIGRFELVGQFSGMR